MEIIKVKFVNLSKSYICVSGSDIKFRKYKLTKLAVKCISKTFILEIEIYRFIKLIVLFFKQGSNLYCFSFKFCFLFKNNSE